MNLKQDIVVTETAIDARAELERAAARLDFGDTLPIYQIEQLCGVVRGTDAYRIACLHVKNAIEAAFLRREVPVEVLVRIDADVGVYVLTPTEASYAGERRGRLARKKQRKVLDQLSSQPRAMIAEARIAEHDRAVEVNSRVVQAIDRETRRRSPPPAPAPVSRQTPGRAKTVSK